MFKAPYFQAELLFYFFSFSLFLLMWEFLRNPGWLLATSIGILAGISHLTKASILPGLILFLGFAAMKVFWIQLFKNDSGNQSSEPGKDFMIRFAQVLLVAVVFLATIFPYILKSKRTFGRYFYNVNSTFYIWYDSWEDVKSGTRAYGDREGWPDMPQSEIPGLNKYLQEHTFRDILLRFLIGSQTIFMKMVNSYGYFKYILLFLVGVLLLMLKFPQKFRENISRNPFIFMFLVSYFVMYWLLYSWYVPIADGNRFVLALFIPLMFTLSQSIYRFAQGQYLNFQGKHFQLINLFCSLILVIFIFDLIFSIFNKIGVMYGGS
jgi:hypothetical protein